VNNTAPVKVYKTYSAKKNFELALPKEQSEYIFEVFGDWNNTHNTSDIFRVKIK